MPKPTDFEAALWRAAATLPVVGPWVLLAQKLRNVVGGDQTAALKAIRQVELARRKANDRRLG